MTDGNTNNQKLSMEALGRLTSEAFKMRDKLPVIIVLDNVRSALNIGSIFRSCDAFAVEELLLIGVCATPPHKEILKTALGSSETVAWRYFEDASSCLGYLFEKQISLFSVEQTTQSIQLQQFSRSKIKFPLALVFGNEVEGVSDSFLRASAGVIEIPQFGTKHSINVAVCAGIVIWELAAAFFLHKDLPNNGA
jgi:23S rRNA (guanosine2251-2'-O)-methyltransferase